MKLILHKLVHVGMNSPRTFGILVEGATIEVYAMDTQYNGVYRLLKLASDKKNTFLIASNMFTKIMLFMMVIRIRDTGRNGCQSMLG
ncbi:hypothetical protein RMATCC62417_14023 [Rhizopus microsporus]|nr:hypothetical protein RMATCC62417_14023 [Rhizopus microsporus]